MGSVRQYDTVKGKRWEARYRRPDGKSARKGGFRVKREAQAYLDQVEVDKRQGAFIAPRAGLVTVSVLAESWLVAHEAVVKPATFRPDKGAWKTHVEPRWGDRQVASIQRSEVRDWVAELASGKSPTVVKRAHGVLAAILDTAVDDRRIPENPARGVKTPRKTAKRHAYLSHAQVECLAAEAKQHGDLVRFLAYTGLRWGEATALRVSHVDLARRRVQVEENAVPIGWEIKTGTPKTHEKRSVVYPEFLSAAVEAAAKGKPMEGLLWGDGTEHVRPGNSTSGWFAGAVKRARAADSTMPRITPHDLRHTAASLAISAGANVKAVQTMLGHASAAMTLDRYSDLFPDDQDAVAAAMTRAREQALSGNAAVTDLRGDVAGNGAQM